MRPFEAAAKRYLYLSQAPIHLSAMADAGDGEDTSLVVHFVDDAIVSDRDAIGINAAQLLGSHRPRCRAESLDRGEEPLAKRERETRDVALCAGLDLNLVRGHDRAALASA